ncbi:DoxX family protein [Streptomyces sp. AD55]|uniref:DoxX family protein n=1 Tax=Streptomyces sp. AD55 TaxID=3242895 RepID=UPI0035291F74
MSVDTRTPRTPTGDRSSPVDDAPALSMVKVPSDPAQVIVNHASFRVQLGASARRTRSPRIARHMSATQDTARVPVAGAVGPAARRRPVVWSGRSEPDDTGAHRLLQAVRAGAGRHLADPAADGPGDAGATQVIPRFGEPAVPGGGLPGYADDYDEGPDTQPLETPVVGAQRGPGDGTRLLPAMRSSGSAYDEPDYADDDFDVTPGTYPGEGAGVRRHGDDPARHAYYPGRRMNLGVVLLPLRVFLGFISVYAGMGKLCDPVYFDGGERGSMVKWLNTLHPWDVAEPLRQFALAHPVGSGLVIAFLQVIVGVLTVLGCWQRLAAGIGALLSAALLVTVSWKSVPAYDAPDIIYLAAWSPLIIAGAPVYSVDGRLAGSAWRRLGPRADIWDLRRYVLRRGAVVTFLVTGITLLVGSLLGGAVRDADRVVVPGPGEAPRNVLPGSPLPQEPGERTATTTPEASSSPTQGATSGATTGPETGGATTTPGATQGTGATTGGAPSQTQGTTGQAPPQQEAPAGQAPSTSAGPTSGGATTGSDGSTGGTGGGGGEEGEPSTGQPGGRLVGGLLG